MASRYLIAENSEKASDFATKKGWGRVGSHKFHMRGEEYIFIVINSSSMGAIYPGDVFFLAQDHEKNKHWKEMSDRIKMAGAEIKYL